MAVVQQLPLHPATSRSHGVLSRPNHSPTTRSTPRGYLCCNFARIRLDHFSNQLFHEVPCWIVHARPQGGACGAASGAPCAGLCLGRPAQRARAVPPLAAFPKGQTHQGGAAVFLGVHCPARGRRIEGGPAGRRTAIGYADPGPGGHSPGFGAYDEGRDKAVDRDNQPTIS